MQAALQRQKNLAECHFQLKWLSSEIQWCTSAFEQDKNCRNVAASLHCRPTVLKNKESVRIFQLVSDCM